MKKFFIPLACILIVACGTSQEINNQTNDQKEVATSKQDSIETLVQKKLDIVAKEKAVDTIKAAKTMGKLKATDPMIMKVPEATSKIDTVKTTKPMKKVAPPDPQIMKVPEATLPIVEDKKAPEVAKIKEETTKPSIATVDHAPWNTLLQKYVTKDGVVNYQGFKKDKTAFRAYLKTLSTTIPQETWSKNEKLAYWMNAYNAFTVKLIVDNYPIKSIKDIKKPWDIRFFQIGKKWYNLNDIEHQILRKMGDPRIHFGINCASFSCPPLLNKAFTANNVDKELEQLAVAFVNDKKRNKISANLIEISKIFQWFGKDFKTKGTLIDFLNQYATTKISPTAKQRFLDYNWNLNE